MDIKLYNEFKNNKGFTEKGEINMNKVDAFTSGGNTLYAKYFSDVSKRVVIMRCHCDKIKEIKAEDDKKLFVYGKGCACSGIPPEDVADDLYMFNPTHSNFN